VYDEGPWRMVCRGKNFRRDEFGHLGRSGFSGCIRHTPNRIGMVARERQAQRVVGWSSVCRVAFGLALAGTCGTGSVSV